MIVYNQIHAGLYDKDEITGEISKVLRCFTNDGVRFDRFPFADNGEYIKATESNLVNWQCTYYLEDGSRPLKTNDCKICEWKDECNHNQKIL
jgi:hypothetical protein